MTGDAGTPPRRTRHVVVMGISGCGKSTVAAGISARTGLRLAEADTFHSPANVAKMSAGIPLDDADRWPWLRDLASWMAHRAAEGVSTVLACSALRRAYRDVLRAGLDGIPGSIMDAPRAGPGAVVDPGASVARVNGGGPGRTVHPACGVEFVHLDGAPEVIRARVLRRPDHYMPASLLDSQLATLEPLQPDECGIVLDVTPPSEELIRQAINRLHLP